MSKPRYKWGTQPKQSIGVDALRDKFAARMREYNLTHGKGCRSIAKAIENREREMAQEGR